MSWGNQVVGRNFARWLVAFVLTFIPLASAHIIAADAPPRAITPQEVLRSQADKGNTSAQTDLALLYLKPGATPDQLAYGLGWLQKAATAGYPRAQYQLGRLYETGLAVPQDINETLLWYKRAAEGWYGPAELQLGLIYEKGLGVSLNRREAQRWYQRAAERDMTEAHATLARLYYEGFFGIKSPEAARGYALMAAAKGDSACAEILAHIEEAGTRRETPDLVEAAKWALLAAWFKPSRPAAFTALQKQLTDSMIEQAKERATTFELARREGGPIGFRPMPNAVALFNNRPVVELQTTFAHTGIVVPLEIGSGEAVPVILDTGANVSLVDERVSQHLNLSNTDETAIGGVGSSLMRAGVVSNLTCKIGGMEFAEGSFSTSSMDYMRPYGAKIRGLIGYNFLSRAVVEIDYAKGVVRFHDPKRFHYDGPGQRLPLRIEDGALYVRTGIVAPDGDVVYDEFFVDTGFSGGINITRYFLRDHEIFRSALKAEGGAALGIGGTMRSTFGRIPGLILGTYRINNPVALFSTSNKGGLAHMPTGLLGAEILSRFHVYFDYSRKEMIIEPNEHLNDPFESTAHGLRFITTGDKPPQFKVNDVIAGTPAEEAGFKMGDILTALDGQPAGELTLSKIYATLGDGKEHALQIKRGSDTLTLRVKERVFI